MSIGYGVVLTLFISVTFFSIASINNSTQSITSITERQNPTIKSINEALIALSEASNSISFGLLRTGIDQLSELQQAESAFNSAVIRYNIFTYALLLGSDSKDFEEAHAGLLFQQWQQLDLNKDLYVPSISKSQQPNLQRSNELFHDFVHLAQKSFALQKKLIRVEINDPLNELSIVKIELAQNEIEMQSLVDQINFEMKALSNRSESIVKQDTRNLYSYLEALKHTVFLLGVMAIIIFSLNMLYLRRSIIIPILKLSKVVERIIEHGDLSEEVQVNIRSQDEIGTLARSFNTMMTKLKQLYSTLEEKVHDKTKELAEKLDELEKLNKLMVGRELRMIELKKEIKKLKGEDQETSSKTKSKK